MDANTKVDFNKCVNWSKRNCGSKSLGRCAHYTKAAFEAAGATHYSGDGFNCQTFCKNNGFKCVGDFYPKGNNPRNGMQFPSGYKQQVGDICLMTHTGGVGHMCWAAGNTINDWVSDYWQRPPQQQKGTGPYCYQSGITHVQFWRHASVMNGAPEVTVSVSDIDYTGGGVDATGSYVAQPQPTPNVPAAQGTVTPTEISSMGDAVSSKYGLLLGTHIRQN